MDSSSPSNWSRAMLKSQNKNLEAAGLADRVELRIGPAAETLAALVKEHAAPFDFIFIDADKSGYPEYLQWSMKLSRPGTLIVADNVVRDGKVIDPESPDPNIQGVRRFTELIAAEPRLEHDSASDRWQQGLRRICHRCRSSLNALRPSSTSQIAIQFLHCAISNSSQLFALNRFCRVYPQHVRKNSLDRAL